MRKFIALSSLLAISAAAHATDAFNNYGTDYLSNSGSTSLIGSNSLYYFRDRGVSVHCYRIGITERNYRRDQRWRPCVTFALYTDVSGKLGSNLGSWSGTASSATGSASANAYTSVAASGVNIISGTKYWLIATNPTLGTANALKWNSSTGTSTGNTSYYYRIGSTNSVTAYTTGMGAFSVQVSSTPKPCTLALLGLSGLAVFGKKRR